MCHVDTKEPPVAATTGGCLTVKHLFGIILSMYQSFHICHLLFSTILEFLFDDKFDTGYLSASLNWLKFNVYISQFINF